MKAATAISKTPLVLALRDSVSGKEVEVPRDAKGQPDFFVAGLKLRRLHDSPAPIAPKPNAALSSAEAKLRTSKKEYCKAAKEYNAALDGYQKAKVATEQARKNNATPASIAKLQASEAKSKEKYMKADAVLGTYRKAYEHDRGVYEKLKKAEHRSQPYDYSTGSYGGFGKKYPKRYGAPLVVAISATPTPKTTPPIMTAKSSASGKSAAPKKNPAAPSVFTAPTPKPKAPVKIQTTTTTPSVKSQKSEVAPVNTPGCDKEHPILYSISEVKDGNIVILTTEGKTLSYPQTTTKYQSQGGGLGCLTLAEGHTLWFLHKPAPEKTDLVTAPKIASKTEASPLPKEEGISTQPKIPPVSTGTSSSSTPATLSGVSDAEAADFSIPVEGYPTAKAPVYVWKHKSQDEFLAVGAGKRIRLNKAQFLSLDKGAHPELYAKGPKTGGKPKPVAPPSLGADF